MAAWGGGGKSAEGILRSAASAVSKEELLVFGYSCKLFRDDERARDVDQGKLLIPWGGDESLRIDRYDARGALHELASLEAPPGGHDWRLELTDAERRVEQLCDEERYRALYCDEEEELMYKEEELKRLHTAGYGQIGFNYDTDAAKTEPSTPPVDSTEADEPFTPSPQLLALLPPDVVLPETQKLNAIIEKTATFIARQGAQMEILLRAKQAGNSQFHFLDKERPLHRYYRALLDAIRANKYNAHPEKEPEVKPEEENDEYLHPSLATTVIESAPLIPSIHYKPSADCDYTMLISRIRGTVGRDEEPPEPAVAAGELAPPGTQPLTLPAAADAALHRAQITRAPVLYRHHSPPPTQEPPEAHDPPPRQESPPAQPSAPAPAPPNPSLAPAKSSGLNLMHYYNSGSESEHSDGEDSPRTPLETPPPDVQAVIDKMAAYVARNGDEFQEIVKAKRDPRFTFLDSQHPYHAYYLRLMLEKRGVRTKPAPARPRPPPEPADAAKEPPEPKHKDDKKKTITPVSFSIKKLKEPEPILPKPALPYESSSDEEKEATESDKATESSSTRETTPAPAQAAPTEPPAILAPTIQAPPPVLKINTSNNDQKPTPKTPAVETETKETKKSGERSKPEPKLKRPEEKPERKRKAESKSKRRENGEAKVSKRKRSRSRDREKSRDRDKSISKEKEGRDRVVGSREESRERSRSRERKKEKPEVITVADRSEDEFIDLTGDLSDGKGEGEGNGERSVQLERKRRAAAFLAAVGRDVTAVAPPPVLQDNTLACAMVKTLEGLRAKKEAAERRRARRAEREERSRLRRDRKLKEEQERGREREERSHHKSKRRKQSVSLEEELHNRDSSSRRKKHKSEKKSSSKSKKSKRSKESSRKASDDAETPPRDPDTKGTPGREANGAGGAKSAEIDVAAIRSKLKMLREESEEELESRRWRAESHESEKKKEYSEGEWETSEEPSSDGDTAPSE